MIAVHLKDGIFSNCDDFKKRIGLTWVCRAGVSHLSWQPH